MIMNEEDETGRCVSLEQGKQGAFYTVQQCASITQFLSFIHSFIFYVHYFIYVFFY